MAEQYNKMRRIEEVRRKKIRYIYFNRMNFALKTEGIKKSLKNQPSKNEEGRHNRHPHLNLRNHSPGKFFKLWTERILLLHDSRMTMMTNPILIRYVRYTRKHRLTDGLWVAVQRIDIFTRC